MKDSSRVELHMFTNAIPSAPSTKVIEDSYASFVKTFGYAIPKVWYHPHPNVKSANKYRERLEKIFPGNVTDTLSLSDGYIKAVKSSSADFLFMLEHDWVFLDNILHTIEDIVLVMQENNIYHLRFNKRKNEAVGCDKYIEEKTFRVPVCFTTCLSNNPHIINRRLYSNYALPFLKKSKGSQGIENNISNIGLIGAIYGTEGYAKTVNHLDGSERKKKTK